MLNYNIGRGKHPYIEFFFAVGEPTSYAVYSDTVDLYRKYTTIQNINILTKFHSSIDNFQLGKYDKLKAATEFASNFPNFISSFIVADNNSNNTYYWEYGKQTPVFSYQRETFFYALNLTDGTIRLKLLNKKKDNKDVLKLKFYYKEPIIY